jgi:elongation of very long chain fatty acids protein 6
MFGPSYYIRKRQHGFVGAVLCAFQVSVSFLSPYPSTTQSSVERIDKTSLTVSLAFLDGSFSELIDTFFIVIGKKKLIFLHWYHHITVLLYCWHSYVTTSPHGVFFMVMNYTVHATMYGYYFLMALKLKPKWFDPMIVTAMQISQMIVGVTVTLGGFYYFKTDPTCHLTYENNTAALVMYGSYLFLFMQFFIERYWHNPAPKAKML